MTVPFQTTRRVEFSDTDMAGIVHFARFFCFMESAEHEYLRACGLSVMMDWEGRRLTFPRVSASCDYARPARFEEILTIAVCVEKIGRSSVGYAFEFTRQGERLATGTITTVCCAVGEGHRLEAVEVPATLREKLARGPAT